MQRVHVAELRARSVKARRYLRNFLRRVSDMFSGFCWVFRCVWVYHADPLSTVEIDELTEVSSRNLALCLGANQLKLAKRNSGNFSVVIVDADKLKQVNDLEGHLAGNRLLKTLAQNLKDGVRESDTVGRYGGDEFLIVLPGASSGEARRILKRIQENHLDAPFSYGIASCDWGQRRNVTLQRLIRLADGRMYRQKQERKAAS